MTKDNEQFARERMLADAYEKKMRARLQSINDTAIKHMPPSEPNVHRAQNLFTVFENSFVPAFSEKKYEKPSEFFLAEMPWIFGELVYDRFRDAFLYIVDHIRDYPYTFGWHRRSFRSADWLVYAHRIHGILTSLRDSHCLDADIRDVLTGNLPEDARCYLKTREMRTAGFSAAILAYELDQNDPVLEEIVTDVINGDSDFSVVSRPLIRGIIMSHNPRMHQLLCRLLVAAKLQEGLRQAICEEADWGTMEAFHAILSTIMEHDLIRFSAVKRAVGTWVGLMNEDTRDLDRISGKTVELIWKCLADKEFRKECARSEDAMQIHIALWSCSFENFQHGYRLLTEIIRDGTHHQVLAAGYYVSNLENEILRQTAARMVLNEHRERYDILAVYLPSFLSDSRSILSHIINGRKYTDFPHYFESREEGLQFCDWLTEIFSDMKKKELTFSPCIFPWFTAVLKKSELIEKAMILAAALGDQVRIDKLCPYLSECEAGLRDYHFKMLTVGKKTEAVRSAIIDCMTDKSMDTRRAAFDRAAGMELTTDEYLKIEQMLRLRYDDLRRNAMELLLKQEDQALLGTVSRLLASSKAPMRTAGLDLVTQLSKQEHKKALMNACMEFVRAISRPTSQEKILIDALKPKTETLPALRFTEADRYIPEAVLDDYAQHCIRTFVSLFPESRLEAQVRAGKILIHDAEQREIAPCAAAVRARENLKSLSDFFVTHETETFVNHVNRAFPLGCDIRLFSIYKENSAQTTVPRMELWQQWREENGITLSDLFGMFILCGGQRMENPYVIRCGSYIADLYGDGFQDRVVFRYAEHIERIVHELIFETVPDELTQQVASAVGIWIACCVGDEMLIGGSERPADEGQLQIAPPTWVREDLILVRNFAMNQIGPGPAGHFIAHPQISRLLWRLRLTRDDTLRHRIPIAVNVYERTFESTKTYMKDRGQTLKTRVTLLLNQVFTLSSLPIKPPQIPEVATYLYARHYGLISENTLLYHLMAPGCFKKALELVTAVCAMKPEEGNVVSAKTFSMHNGYVIRRGYESFCGKETELSDEQLQLIDLCRKTADTLVPIVVGAELNRGDTPTDYSIYVTGIHVLSGTEIFVKILTALGRDTLDRTVYYWGRNDSKRGNLSYLLARCTPAPEDSAKKLSALLANTDISRRRLIEAALYSPAWIDIVGEYLNLPGFKSACYYFMAHMNERFDEQKKAIIARYSPLSEDEFNQGAFDVDWFRSAYEQLGERMFDMIYDAAKYISDGGKHTRGRKFADAALGRLDTAETEAAIQDKRNKDLLMAYAIIPLTGEDDLIRRYLFIQQF